MSKGRSLLFLLVCGLLVLATAIPTSSVEAAESQTIQAGRNVNMVSGTTLPDGDPWLQRQNEPSIAVSTRNPLHLLAGANDYRTVDMSIEGEQIPGQEEKKTASAFDAWLGVFKSFDGGQSWTTALLHGFPQDSSPEGLNSPLKGFAAAADPVVRAGPNGLFYYSGIAFNRTKIPGKVNGVVFIARFIDSNDKEGGDSIKYIDTKIIATDQMQAQLFIDKPWIAVDVPKKYSKTVTINGQKIPVGNVYIAYSAFTESGGTQKSDIVFRRSTDCGQTWEKAIILSKGHLLNQAATICINPRENGHVYVAWRRFDSGNQTSAIIIAGSTNEGKTFDSITKVASLDPFPWGGFDQPSIDTLPPSTGPAFRTNSYPTMAIDDKGVVYLAWTQRGCGPNEEARIVLTTSKDGFTWTAPMPIDNPMDVLGHQFMPSLTFAAGKLTMVWYDQRDDYYGEAYGFGFWIRDDQLYRHTVDVWAAQADTKDYPYLKWTSTQVSRYLFSLEKTPDENGDYIAYQAQYNPPNYPLFKTGTVPFFSDYLDITPSPWFVLDKYKRWHFNTKPSANPLFHASWTDNRDVRPPSDGKWTDYVPADSAQPGYISENRPPCQGGQHPGMRNQNIYTAQITTGIAAGSPTNTKALDLDVPRSFVVFVKNNTDVLRSFRLTIANQPVGGQASFLQFDFLDTLDVSIAPFSTIARQVFVDSTDLHATVNININEIDIPGGSILRDGITGSVTLNGDPSSPGIVGTPETHAPEIETPHIRNWYVSTNVINPHIRNVDIVNPDIVNSNILNAPDSDSVNPNILNSELFNPHIRNFDMANLSIVNPHIRNAALEDMSISDVVDVEWPVRNVGNTASSFTFKIIAKESLPEGLYAQLIVYKVYYTPAVAGEALENNEGVDGCVLKQEPHHELLLNVINPNLINPNIVNPNILSPHIRNAEIENATFVLGPGEEAIVDLRIIQISEAQTTQGGITTQQIDLPIDIESFVESVGAAVTAQSVDTEDAVQGIEEPQADATTLIIGTSTLPPGIIDAFYPPAPYLPDSAQLKAVGGTEPYSWWVNPAELPPGLSLNLSSGLISGTPLRDSGKTYPCTYNFIAQATDSSSPQQSDNQSLSITIEDPVAPPPPLTITTTSPLPAGTVGKIYGATLAATGGAWPYAWTVISGSLPPGLLLDGGGFISGTPGAEGPYYFRVRVTDSGSPSQIDERDFSLTIQAATAPAYTISGTVSLGTGGAPLAGVLMRGLPSAPTTNSYGSYSDTVPQGWSGTATPFKAGYYFVPSQISYANVTSNQDNQNYTAYPVALDHFEFDPINPQNPNSPFAITITARDASGNTVTTYSDSNALSDTTGTISPKSTGAFSNGVWSGQVVISKAAPNVVIKTTGGGKSGQSNAFSVSAGMASSVKIEDAPDGTGSEVNDLTISPGYSFTVYAISRDNWNNFVENAPATWSLINKTGGVADSDLVPAANNKSATFTAHGLGSARIQAQHATLGIDTTGIITVAETMPDDIYEENDSFATATEITLGTHTRLVLNDEDWFKFYVPAGAGKDLRVRLRATSYPDPNIGHDLDFMVLNSSEKLLSLSISGSDDEFAYICDVPAGWYYVGQTYVVQGVIYSLSVELSDYFDIGFISGRVTDEQGNGIENAYVELYGDPYNVYISRPLILTDANGNYKIGYTPGNYTVRFNLFNLNHRDPWFPDVNYLGKAYNSGEIVSLAAGTTLPGIDAELTPGGTITGRVTDADGNGISNARADVYASNLTRVSLAFTDANGNYLADRMQTGNYKVRFRAPWNTNYGDEWYDDRISFEEGLPVPVQAGSVTPNIDARLDEGAYIEGHVTDGSNPIKGVLITAYDVAGISLNFARTDSNGFYRLNLLPEGEVKLFFNAADAAGNYVSEYYPDKLLIGEAIPVPVQRGQTTYGIDAQLAVGGTITGRVTGPSGNGLYNVPVMCHDTNSEYWSYAYTNINGDYSLAHLPADTYRVRFRPGIGNYALEWYNNVYSFAEAQDIPVGPGQTIPNIDAQVPDNGGFISGRVTESNGIGIEGITIWVRDGTMIGSIATSVTTAGGYYTVPRLPTSGVKVYFDADTGYFNFASEYYNDKPDHAIADIVFANFGQTTENINAVLAPIPALAITTESPLPDGEAGVLYNGSLQATGGRPFYAWSIISGTLPNGLTLNSKGEILGMPTLEGTFDFTVRVIDSTNPQKQAEKALSLTIQAYSYPAYVIAGTVLFNGSPFPNVAMTGLPGDPVTNGLGQYTINVSPGWSGTVTPTLAGYAFNPPNRTYTTVSSNFQNEDYTATIGWAISGNVTLNGSPLQGVLMSGLPGEPRTNASGFYTAAVPDGWSGTVTPTLPGFTFDPPSRSYTIVTSDQPAQDYTASFQGEQDDAFEENDDFSSAAAINPGFYTNLVLADQDWFRVYVDSADAGKDLKVHIKGISYPNPNVRKDLDFMILNSSGKLLSYNQSGGDDETAYICDVSSGWYYIGNTYWESPGTIYSLLIEIGKNFGISYIQGRVTDEMGEGIENVYVELYGEPFHWDICRPLVTTDASGYYKVGFLPGNYTVRFNLTNNYHRDPYMPDVNYIGKTYNSNEVITILPGATITGIDAELAQGGTISGRITDPGGNGLASARVDVYAGDSTRVAVGLPDSNGYYLAERLRTGNYKVRFRSTGPNNYALEWYDSTAAFEDGLPVPVQAGSITPNIDAQLENWETVEGFIEGQVTDTSGTPLRGIGVIAYDNVGQTIWSAGTDDTGHYRLRRLAPGQVKIFFNAQGEPGNYVSEYYSDKYSLAEADPVSVQTGQTTYGIDAQLAAGGTITGRVTDAQGNPYFGLNMACFDTVTERYYVATYDINGNYTLTNLPPGNYKVRFRPTAGNYAVEWFNNKGSFAEGDVVSVAAGETTSGIDAQITDGGGFITGRVTSNGTTGIEGVQVWARDSIKQGVISSVITDADGNYALPRIPNCQAKVFFNTDVDYFGYASEHFNDKSSFETADLISGVLGETMPNINAVLAPIPGLAITTASLPNGELAAPYNISLQASGGRQFYYWSLDSGTLPNGLTLNAKGEIRGTPTATGTFNFTVRVSDSTRPSQRVVTKFLTITINAYSGADYLISGAVNLSGSPLAGVLMAGLPGALVTNAWGEYIAVVPPGWSGTVTPTLAGYFFDPGSRNYSGVSSNQSGQDYAAYVQTLNITTDWLLNGTEGFPYSQTLEAAEGTPPYSWSIASGSLPEGLDIESGGLIHGTPTNPGTYNFTVRVIDSSLPNQRVEKPLSIAVHGSGMISEAPILYWKFNEAGMPTVQDSSGKGNHGSLNNNVLYTEDSVEGYAVETYENSWITANTQGGQFYFADEATIMAHVKIDDFSRSRRFLWKLQYNHPVRNWPYTIEVYLDIAGNMLVLDSANGLKEDIFHCPHIRLEIDLSNPVNGFNLGEYNHIAVTIKDGQYKFFINGNEKASAQGALFEVNDNVQCFWVAGASWSEYWLGGKIDEVAVYNRTFTPQQVTDRYTEGPMHTISGTVFLNGGGLSGAVLSGLPGNPTTNANGDYIAPVINHWSGTVTPTLPGYAFEPASRTYSDVISDLSGENYQAFTSGYLQISTGSLPGGTKNSPYNMWLEAVNGTPEYSWSIISGLLPSGLTLDASGEIHGTPTEAGDFAFSVRVTDSSTPQQFATQDYGLTIAAAHQGFWTTTYPYGGPIRPLGLVTYRGEGTTIYAAPQWRGVYKSEDGGGSWTSITDYLQLPFDRTDMRIFLVRNSNEFYTAGHTGLFKSINAGQNWTNISGSISSRVTALALHPTAGNTLYAGTENGQIFKSEDGGFAWSNISTGLPSNEIRVIAVNPADISMVYAGTFSSGIYRSINGGAWESANGASNLRRVEDIAFHPTNPSLFYLAGNDSGVGDGIFKTANGGAIWTRVLDTGIRWEAGYYIAINPTSPEIVYVVSGSSVNKSADAGSSWTSYPVASTNTTSIIIDPNYPETLYVGTDGEGVFNSTNGAGSWTEVNNGIRAMNFMHSESHSLHIDSTNPDIIYAGSIKGGYRTTNGGATWEKMNHPEWTISSIQTRSERPGKVFTLGSKLWRSDSNGISESWFDPSDGNFSCSGDGDLGIAYESGGDQIILYAGVTNGPGSADGVFRSTDGGINWELKNYGLTNPQIDTLTVHPTNSSIIFVSTQAEQPPEPGKNTRLYRTTDGGESWEHITCGLPDFLNIDQIVFSPSNPDIMYMGAPIENGGVYRSDNGGGCWYKVFNGNINTVAVHPANPNIVYAGAWNAGGFYFSLNGGQTWSTMNGGLPVDPGIESMALDPANPYHVFIGTTAGVYEATFTFDFSITTASLPTGIVNEAYSATLQAFGGTLPYTWKIISGALPPGLDLNQNTGEISGLPTTRGTFDFRVKVTDSGGQTFIKNLNITIFNIYVLNVAANPTGGGSVSKSPDAPRYTEGTTVDVSATPDSDAGYLFTGWSGDASGRTPLIHVQITRDKNITANFALIADLPDYHINSFNFPATANAGQVIGGLVNVSVGNQGVADLYAGGISVGLYLSADPVIATSDTLLWKGRSSIAALSGGATVAVPIDPQLQIPSTVSAGDYYIGVLVDETDVIAERDEGNNTASQAITISSAGYDQLAMLGGWPSGACYGFDIDPTRNLAVIANGALFQILDVSSPAHPVLLSQLSLAPSYPVAIKIVGTNAYAAAGAAGLKVIDISNPLHPAVIGTCNTIESCRSLDVSGNYAYVTDHHKGFRVIDISNPTAPSQVAFLPFSGRTRLIKVSGNIAYVTRQRALNQSTGPQGVQIIDISNPSSPVSKTFIELGAAPGELDVDSSGRFLFVPLPNNYLRIYDVSNPDAPFEVASYTGARYPTAVTVVGHYAYVPDQNEQKLVILDISDAYHPTEVSVYRFTIPVTLFMARVAGPLCFVSSWYDSLRIVDFSNLNTPREAGFYDIVGLLSYADVANNHAFIANTRYTGYRLKVLDMSSLPNITETASLNTPYPLSDLVTSGSYAYLPAYDRGLRMIDISNPSAPVEAGAYEGIVEAQDIAISGKYAYVADGSSGLRVFDISTPSVPVLVSTLNIGRYVLQVALSGNYAYLAANWGGLRIIDVSDPFNPWQVGTYEFDGRAINVSVAGDYAYVNDNYNLLRIVNVSNPSNPVEVATFNLYYTYGDIGITGNFLIVPDWIWGVRVIDISNPANPIEVDLLREYGTAEEIIIRENRIYIVNRDTGFYVVEFRLH